MEHSLGLAAHYLGLGLEALALLVIAVGGVEAAIGIVRIVLRRHASDAARRGLWLGFAHWLVAGLTFQLAADIVHTTVTPGWEEIGRVAAIAAIRTFLTFFLDRDIELQHRRTDDDNARRS